MPISPNKPALVLALAALAAGLPVRAADEVSSANHPVLTRALAEHPTADADGNGSLSLAEYDILQKKPLVQPPAEQDQPPPAPLLPLLPVLPNGEVVVCEFEDPNSYKTAGWTIEGAAFQSDLAQGTRVMRHRVGSFQGTVFLTTRGKSEAETGRLVSPPFPLELDFLAVTLSGGRVPQRVGVNVWIGEELVRSVTGNNDDYFETVALDVREFRGRMARVELLDQHSGIWGHLNVDRIVLTANPGGEARRIDSRPPPPPPLPGLALTAAGRQAGPLTITDGKLTSAQAPLVAESLLLAINAQDPTAVAAPDTPPPSAVQLIGGETWHAQILGLEGKTLAINSPLIGPRKVSLEDIASIEFQSADADAPREPGHLYCTGGEPIPGTLVWIRDKDIAVDCPLGVIPVERPTVERYVVAKPKPAEPSGTDVVGLAGGGLLRGKITFAGNQLVVNHGILGELKLDWKSVGYLRRATPGLDWLEDLVMTVEERDALTLPPPPPQWIEGDGDSHLRALRIMPESAARFALKTNAGSKLQLRAEIAPVLGCRTAMKVTVLSGDTAVWNQTIPPGSAPVPLSLDLSAATQLAITVEFEGPLAFPSGIEMRDPLVLNLAQLATEPQPTQPN